MSAVLKVYQEVIEDVISGVREYFLESGVEEHVLQDLKQAWESKLLASKAVSHQKTEGGGGKKLVHANEGESKGAKQPLVGQLVPPNNHVQTPGANATIIENKMVPIQITLPAQPGSELPQRVLSIQVPASALQGNQLHKVLTGPVISATMGLPQQIANNLLQQHVNAALCGTAPTLTVGPPVVTKPVIQGDAALKTETSDEEDVELPKFTIEPGCSGASTSTSTSTSNDAALQPSCSKKSKRKRQPKIVLVLNQNDGGNDTSDEDDDGSDDDEDSEDPEEDRDEDEQEMEDAGPEEEPLNSEDDVTDEDPADLFDTENVVVCQYDKISRTRNKWKFHLKDGIMNMNGEDYLFQRANGDAEW